LDEKELLKYIQKPLHDILAEFDVLQADSPAEKDKKERQQVTIWKYDKKCKNLIVQRIADSHLECVKEKVTAYEVWEVLQNTFERKSMAKQIPLKRWLLTF
jgi:predicted DNA binding CopG/RHH family protein